MSNPELNVREEDQNPEPNGGLGCMTADQLDQMMQRLGNPS